MTDNKSASGLPGSWLIDFRYANANFQGIWKVMIFLALLYKSKNSWSSFGGLDGTFLHASRGSHSLWGHRDGGPWFYTEFSVNSVGLCPSPSALHSRHLCINVSCSISSFLEIPAQESSTSVVTLDLFTLPQLCLGSYAASHAQLLPLRQTRLSCLEEVRATEGTILVPMALLWLGTNSPYSAD